MLMVFIIVLICHGCVDQVNEPAVWLLCAPDGLQTLARCCVWMYANVPSQRHGLAIERRESVCSSKVFDSGANELRMQTSVSTAKKGRWHCMALVTYIQNSTERKNIVHSRIYPEWVRTYPPKERFLAPQSSHCLV